MGVEMIYIEKRQPWKICLRTKSIVPTLACYTPFPVIFSIDDVEKIRLVLYRDVNLDDGTPRFIVHAKRINESPFVDMFTDKPEDKTKMVYLSSKIFVSVLELSAYS